MFRGDGIRRRGRRRLRLLLLAGRVGVVGKRRCCACSWSGSARVPRRATPRAAPPTTPLSSPTPQARTQRAPPPAAPHRARAHRDRTSLPQHARSSASLRAPLTRTRGSLPQTPRPCRTAPPHRNPPSSPPQPQFRVRELAGLLNILLQSVTSHEDHALGARVIQGMVFGGSHTLVLPVSHP